ncbi:hypothetical protein PIB30_084951, partial [Stylosanthes scabra]|nr:hypothetical protein [Stylosanthes scabra]
PPLLSPHPATDADLGTTILLQLPSTLQTPRQPDPSFTDLQSLSLLHADPHDS